MKQIELPKRFDNLQQVDNLIEGWDLVKLAIRPERRTDNSIEKTKIAIDAGLNDAAINYMWNLSMYDMQSKIYAYGVDYFSSAINWDGKPLKTVEDLREVKDHQIISGAFALGILLPEAHFFLQQCREIRNNFSTAHHPMGEIDRFETGNFIKNCIKYILTFDLPTPGLQIKDLIENLTLEKLDNADEVTAIIEHQSSKVHGPILHNLFSNFIKQDCHPNLKYNIKLIAPQLWEIVSDDVKGSVAAKFSSLRDLKGKDAAGEALNFLKIVNGITYVPETFKDIIFRKHAQHLIDAHNDWNNFHHEPGHARELSLLGSEVPVSAMYVYVKAIVMSTLGNGYGVARDAQKYNVKMISNLSQTGVRTLFNILIIDMDVIRKLTNTSSVNRLIEIMELISEKTMLPKQKEIYDFIISNTAYKTSQHFLDEYWKLVNKK